MNTIVHRKTRRRREITGHARYLTFSCFHRRPLLDEQARNIFADRLIFARDRHGFLLYAWVAMPEHVHLLIRPFPPTLEVPRILMTIKRPVATAALGRIRKTGAPAPKHFWQAGGGYDRNIYSDHELAEKIDYIHQNPVRRGLVERAEDWTWSSARVWRGFDSRWPVVDRA